MTTSTLQHNDNKAVEVENRVIKKLFRRLITFLFVLFVFSFLDRINIGFAGLTMGKDLGLTSTMFGLAATLFYVTYVLCGIPSTIMLAKKLARAPLDRRDHGGLGGSPRPAPCSPPARIRCTSCACWSASPRLVFCRGSSSI